MLSTHPHIIRLKTFQRKKLSHSTVMKNHSSLESVQKSNSIDNNVFISIRAVEPTNTFYEPSPIPRRTSINGNLDFMRMNEKRKDILSKTFNRTKTDSAHNFTGKKYLSQIQKQKKTTSMASGSPFLRRCQKKQRVSPSKSSFAVSLKHQQLQNLITQNKQEKVQAPYNKYKKTKMNKMRYFIRKNCDECEGAVNSHNLLKSQDEIRGSDITPWDSVNNSSWLPQY